MKILKKLKDHSVTRNALALSVMQIGNYAVPLLLLPFLTRQLGMEAFGVVAITLAAIQLAFVLTDYGFSLSATYSISTNRENTDYVNRKIAAIFGAKALLLSLLAIALIIATQTAPYIEAHTEYVAVAFIVTALADLSDLIITALDYRQQNRRFMQAILCRMLPLGRICVRSDNQKYRKSLNTTMPIG